MKVSSSRRFDSSCSILFKTGPGLVPKVDNSVAMPPGMTIYG